VHDPSFALPSERNSGILHEKGRTHFKAFPWKGKGDHEVVDEVDRRLSKIKESETPKTTSSVTYGASFPY